MMAFNSSRAFLSTPQADDSRSDPPNLEEQTTHKASTSHPHWYWGTHSTNGHSMSFFTNSLKNTVSAILLRASPNDWTRQYADTDRYTGSTESHSINSQRSFGQEQTSKERDGFSAESLPCSPVDHEQLTDSLQRTLHEQNAYHPTGSYEDLCQSDYIYDVMILTPRRSRIRRRMVIDFETEINIMSEAVYKKLDTHIESFTGNDITWWNQSTVRPLGKCSASWTICGRERLYYAEFLVVGNTQFDVLLGRESVRQLGLYRADPWVATRLRSSNKQ
ncbi:uncharacterized protein LDX57_010377 [Aspergillus melleus]|uniref:uncharacterized protein n=1 Tax=Aspergillus melleus TaxID=138277 RepID=UPI001E8CAC59|nr:uncharacterized protein LDX57_010377 [Aspergillus melleus]KAH8432751.1 hypothetical protein LDX57_010377 [Aspergillus melleus]